MKTNVYITLGVLLILATSLTPTSASVVITDDFDDLSDWFLRSANGTDYYEPSEITNENGALQFPETCCYLEYGHEARRNSTITYGTWSVDWKISDTGNSLSVIEIMLKDNITFYDWDGVPTSETRMMGYALLISSFNTYSFSPTPGMIFYKYLGNDASTFYEILGEFEFTENLQGWHHIDITRSASGNFSIIFDEKFLFSVTDNEWKVSEKFALVNFAGATAFDNLRISNTVDLNPDDYPGYNEVDTTTPPIDTDTNEDDSPLLMELFMVSILTIVLIKRRLNI